MKNKIIISFLIILGVMILIICIFVFTNKDAKKNNSVVGNKEEEKSNVVNDKEPELEYREIEIKKENEFYETTEVNLDLNNDGIDEKIKITKAIPVIEINNKKYFDDADDEHTYQYIIIDLDFDGKLEIIQRGIYKGASPASSIYTIYSYNGNNIKKRGSFRIIGNIPNIIYSNGKTIKFEYWPYETLENNREEVVVNLSK